MTKITIDGVDYLPAKDESQDIRIVVLQRGWVYVGYYHAEGDKRWLTSAACVRNWGTDSDKPGLGYIAINGPTDKTKLDKCPTVRWHEVTEINTIDCEADKWQNHL